MLQVCTCIHMQDFFLQVETKSIETDHHCPSYSVCPEQLHRHTFGAALCPSTTSHKSTDSRPMPTIQYQCCLRRVHRMDQMSQGKQYRNLRFSVWLELFPLDENSCDQ